jgi:glutathione S-transferase
MLMIASHTEATVFYSHSAQEVHELAQAMIPLGPHIKAVSSHLERQRSRHILAGDHFLLGDARSMCAMLRRAAKHARANLSDYFPYLRSEILKQADSLEIAVDQYWRAFKSAQAEAVPVDKMVR